MGINDKHCIIQLINEYKLQGAHVAIVEDLTTILDYYFDSMSKLRLIDLTNLTLKSFYESSPS